MPRRTIYECKVCGIEKQNSNHWLIIKNAAVAFHLYAWAWAIREGCLDDEGTDYICGQNCAHKLLDQFLADAMKPRDPILSGVSDQ